WSEPQVDAEEDASGWWIRRHVLTASHRERAKVRDFRIEPGVGEAPEEVATRHIEAHGAHVALSDHLDPPVRHVPGETHLAQLDEPCRLDVRREIVLGRQETSG